MIPMIDGRGSDYVPIYQVKRRNPALGSMNVYLLLISYLPLNSVSGFLLPLGLPTSHRSCVASAPPASSQPKPARCALKRDRSTTTTDSHIRPPTTAPIPFATRSTLSPLRAKPTMSHEDNGSDEFDVDFDDLELDGPSNLQPGDFYNPDDYELADSVDGMEGAASPSSRKPTGDLDALDDLLGLHKTAAAGAVDEGDLDALDDLLRRDAARDGGDHVSGLVSGNTANRPLQDDGFGALDDLLGLDDGPRRPLSPSTVSTLATSAPSGKIGQGADGGDMDVDPSAAMVDSSRPGDRDLARTATPLLPPAAVSNTQVPPTSTPAAGEKDAEGEILGDWLDDLLSMEDERFTDPTGGGDRGMTPGGRKVSGAEPAPATSWFDDIPDISPTAKTTDATPRRSIHETQGNNNDVPNPQSPQSVDDWLSDLLDEDDEDFDSRQPSAMGKRDGSSGGGDSPLSDVITGSSALEGWKTQTAPVRSNVMGRSGGGGRFGGNRRGARDQDDFGGTTGRGRGQGGRGRTKDYQESRQSGSDHWGGASSSSGGKWGHDAGGGDFGASYGSTDRGVVWDNGLDDDAGRPRGDRSHGDYELNPTEMAQRAVTADLKMLGSRGRWEDALKALVGARMRGVPVNNFMYNTAISAVGKSGRWKEALSMMKQMEEDGVEQDTYTYSGAIRACGKGGQWLKALELLNEMPDKGIMPDIPCYAAAVEACADGGQSDHALDVMSRMKEDGYVPEKSAYNAAIVACGEKGEWERSLEIISEMRVEGLRPDQFSYQFAMKACGAGGRWERAVLLLHEMEEDGSTPELESYQAVLEILKDAGQWKQALALIDEMDEVGIVPDETCFASVLEVCGEHGRWWEAIEVIKTIRDLHLQPDLESYHSALRACMKGKKWMKAFFIMEEIRRTGRRPNQETWDLIFETCRVCGRWEAAVGALSDMFAEEVWYDTSNMRQVFETECPDAEHRSKALYLIQMEEEIDGPKKKRMKKRNISSAAKRRRDNPLPPIAKPKARRSARLPKPKPEFSNTESIDALEF